MAMRSGLLNQRVRGAHHVIVWPMGPASMTRCDLPVRFSATASSMPIGPAPTIMTSECMVAAMGQKHALSSIHFSGHAKPSPAVQSPVLLSWKLRLNNPYVQDVRRLPMGRSRQRCVHGGAPLSARWHQGRGQTSRVWHRVNTFAVEGGRIGVRSPRMRFAALLLTRP